MDGRIFRFEDETGSYDLSDTLAGKPHELKLHIGHHHSLITVCYDQTSDGLIALTLGKHKNMFMFPAGECEMITETVKYISTLPM